MNPPVVPIEQVQGRLARLWDPFQRTAHITVFGMNGTGKTHLVRYGILPVRAERTVVLDVKGDAGVNPWTGWGTTVYELPACWEGRVRLILTGATESAKRRARAALELLHLDGYAVVVADDMRTLTDRERFGCSALIEALATEGRSRGVMLVMGAQSVAYATPSLKDQAGAIFVGQMTSRSQVKDLADLTGYGRELVPALASIPSRRFFYTDRWEDATVACVTGV